MLRKTETDIVMKQPLLFFSDARSWSFNIQKRKAIPTSLSTKGLNATRFMVCCNNSIIQSSICTAHIIWDDLSGGTATFNRQMDECQTIFSDPVLKKKLRKQNKIKKSSTLQRKIKKSASLEYHFFVIKGNNAVIEKSPMTLRAQKQLSVHFLTRINNHKPFP